MAKHIVLMRDNGGERVTLFIDGVAFKPAEFNHEETDHWVKLLVKELDPDATYQETSGDAYLGK